MTVDSLTYDSTFDDVAKALILECDRRGYSRDEAVAVTSTGIQESGLRMVKHPRADWWGYFQQDASYPNRMNPKGNIFGFLDRLDVKRRSSGASPDPFKTIFWLQQRPSDPSADIAYAKGRKEYYDEIQRHVAQAGQLYDRFAGGKPMGWRGDPVWLPDILRDEGLPVQVAPGAFERGHGDMGDIWGVFDHHTGSDNASWQSIAFHPSLGLASQLHLAYNGHITVCGVGIAYHAGNGSWPGLGTNNANPRTIGVEAANDGGGTPGRPHRLDWPAVQYDNYVRLNAAILRFLKYGSDRSIGHKEWAGASQGKWDPGGISMPLFRNDIQSLLSGGGDDMAQVPQDQWDRVFQELTKRFPSRSKYRASDGPVDTVAGMVLNNDAMSHEALIERNALLGNKEAIALVKRQADKGDAWAKLVYDKCPKD